MYHSNQLTKTNPSVRNSIRRLPLRRAFLLTALALALTWFALSPTARAVTPPPDGGYPGSNTAEGTDALLSLTSGTENTAIGFEALYSNTGGFGNTAIGNASLIANSGGNYNTAIGDLSLAGNTTGSNNTASGFEALANNNGGNNTADGSVALFGNTTGLNNTASGFSVLYNNSSGGSNTGIGYNALLNNTTGSNNIALGASAGSNLTTGSNNIDIGGFGVAGESNTIRLGKTGLQKTTYITGIRGATVAGGVTVMVDGSGHLGTITSSVRYKDNVQPMGKASEAILALKPVTFRYKHELDPDGIPQFGLVAEQVEKVNPALVARDDEGKAYTVRYEAVNAMLLNEFLKEHRKGQDQDARIEQQQATIAGVEIHPGPTAKRLSGSHSARRRAGCAHSEGRRTAGIKQSGVAKGRRQSVKLCSPTHRANYFLTIVKSLP